MRKLLQMKEDALEFWRDVLPIGGPLTAFLCWCRHGFTWTALAAWIGALLLVTVIAVTVGQLTED